MRRDLRTCLFLITFNIPEADPIKNKKLNRMVHFCIDGLTLEVVIIQMSKNTNAYSFPSCVLKAVKL